MHPMVGDSRDEALRCFATRHWPDLDWRTAKRRHGAFHDVLVCVDGPVLRVAAGPDHQSRATREARTMLTVASSSLQTRTPSPLSPVISDDAQSGVLTTAIAGVEHPDQEWDDQLRTAYRGLLDDLAAVPVADVGVWICHAHGAAVRSGQPSSRRDVARYSRRTPRGQPKPSSRTLSTSIPASKPIAASSTVTSVVTTFSGKATLSPV